MGKASRVKGAEGEREVANTLRMWGFDAKRGGMMQSQAAGAAPDVVVKDLPYWIEVKRGQKAATPYPALEQASEVADGLPVIVIGRSDRKPTIVTMYMGDFLNLLRAAHPEAIRKDIYDGPIGVEEKEQEPS